MRYTLANFNEFRDACHTASVNAGWWKRAQKWDTGNTFIHTTCEFGHDATIVDRGYEPDRLLVPTKLCLIHSEISEMYEGYMSGDNDDHLPHLPGALVEGGDVLIRIGDLAGYLQVDLASAIALVLQADHVESHANVSGCFARLHGFTSGAMEGYRKSAPDAIIPALSAFAANLARVVILIDMIATKNDWDLPAAAEAKMAYNAVRLDHKAEVRALSDGKQF